MRLVVIIAQSDGLRVTDLSSGHRETRHDRFFSKLLAPGLVGFGGPPTRRDERLYPLKPEGIPNV